MALTSSLEVEIAGRSPPPDGAVAVLGDVSFLIWGVEGLVGVEGLLGAILMELYLGGLKLVSIISMSSEEDMERFIR